MKTRAVVLLVSLALLSLGLGGCRIEGGAPCCWQDHQKLLTQRSMKPCCEQSAPTAVPGTSTGPGTNVFSPGASVTLAIAHFALEPLGAVAALAQGAAPSHPLYTLECALRL